jgi:hypothetical protein
MRKWRDWMWRMMNLTRWKSHQLVLAVRHEEKSFLTSAASMDLKKKEDEQFNFIARFWFYFYHSLFFRIKPFLYLILKTFFFGSFFTLFSHLSFRWLSTESVYVWDTIFYPFSGSWTNLEFIFARAKNILNIHSRFQ